METEAATLAATPPANGASLWQRLDRVGSYIFAGLVITVGLVTPMVILINTQFRWFFGQ